MTQSRARTSKQPLANDAPLTLRIPSALKRRLEAVRSAYDDSFELSEIVRCALITICRLHEEHGMLLPPRLAAEYLAQQAASPGPAAATRSFEKLTPVVMAKMRRSAS